jgi:hypothetical protein
MTAMVMQSARGLGSTTASAVIIGILDESRKSPRQPTGS